MTDRHPDTDKQNGMTIRLTLCERDAILMTTMAAAFPTTRSSGVSAAKLTVGRWKSDKERG